MPPPLLTRYMLMSAPDLLDRMAARQLADYDRHHPGQLFADGHSLTIREAYDVQRRVTALRQARGERVAGYKVGCVSKRVRAQLGLDDPVFGYVFETEVHSSGCTLDFSSYDRLAVEGEFAVRLACDIPGPAWLDKHGYEGIAALFPVIELHNHVFRGSYGRASELIANNAIHAGLVLPSSEVPLRNAEDLVNEPISVWLNGQELDSTEPGAVPPLASLRALAVHLLDFGIQLQHGQIVLTGSALSLYPVHPGDRVEVRCGSLPGVAAVIAPTPLENLIGV